MKFWIVDFTDDCVYNPPSFSGLFLNQCPSGESGLIYKGGCHCGKISFQVEGAIEHVIECNCSICTKRGNLLWFVDRQKLELLTPESNLSTYTFNKHYIKHRFCSVCGCGPFGEAADKTGKSQAAVNVRCLEGIDLTKIKKVPFDGRSL